MRQHAAVCLSFAANLLLRFLDIPLHHARFNELGNERERDYTIGAGEDAGAEKPGSARSRFRLAIIKLSRSGIAKCIFFARIFV